ncbi:MAG: DUF6494 family protein [Paracoccaceae bacterium]
MSNEDFNMSMRKFLKQVGVTSQQKIEKAIRTAQDTGAVDKKTLPVRVTLTMDDIGLSHVVEGEIVLGDEA